MLPSDAPSPFRQIANGRKTAMSINIRTRRVQRLRLLIWILMGVILLLRFEIIPHLVPHAPESIDTLLQGLFFLLWALQGFGIWWAQKLNKRDGNAFSDTGS